MKDEISMLGKIEAYAMGAHAATGNAGFNMIAKALSETTNSISLKLKTVSVEGIEDEDKGKN